MKILDIKNIKKPKFDRKMILRVILVAGAALLLFIVFYVPTMPYRPPKVTSVTPINGAIDVMNRTIVRVTFDKPVPAEEQGSFYLRLLPAVAGNTTWSSPTQLSLLPTQPLQPSTTYKLALSREGETLFESQFTTRFRKVYDDTELNDMREWAFATSQAMYEMKQDYPFLEKLPINTDSFNVMFDSEKNQFRYYLKMDASVPDQTKQEAIDGATSALKLIGVLVEDYGYYVVYSSEMPFK